ncbi:MAG TPA: hypothetical protein PKD90_18205, partial [Phnomibacter sp.]|nr:hypothetical protein [Phnomibacter sp.]
QWLQQFPVLDKPTLRQQRNNLLTRPAEQLIRMVSSGSSGYQSEVFVDKEQVSISRAIQTVWMEWAGYKIGNPILQTGINPTRSFEKKLKDFFFQTNYLNAFAHTEQQVLEALQWAKKQKEPCLGGYASSLYVLAMLARQHEMKVTFKGAVSWGDKLFAHFRKTIEEAFNCKVYETYGSTEGFMMAAQFDLPYMYMMDPFVIVEIVDDNGAPVPDGTMGHVVVTNMFAKAMPLIRYRIGDLAIKLPKHEYPASRKLALPLLKQVVGRNTDLIKTASGKYMVVHSFTGIFEHIPEISQFCVVQENLHSITIKYIPGNGFHQGILQHITNQIQANLQEAFPIHYEMVDHIKPTPSGKPQLIVSKILQAQP